MTVVSNPTRRPGRRLLTLGVWVLVSGFLTPGCGGEDPAQRQSGTLVVPLDSVEKAGEAAGKAEDAGKATKKAAPAK